MHGGGNADKVSRMNRLGYLVPEFPGQTHIFFWRELQSLAALGVDCDLVSTRLPSKRIVSHDWSQEAMARTTYLAPMTFGGAFAAFAQIARSGPAGWWRLAGAISRSEPRGFKAKIRLVALAVAGGRLAALGRKNRWQHLHVHSCADSANVAMFAHLITGLPYSITLHGPLEDYGLNQRMKWSNAAFGIVITRKLLGEVRTALNGSTPPEIDVAAMGVNVSKFRRKNSYQPRMAGASAASVQSSHGSAPTSGGGVFQIFSCGRLNPCKGHDHLIRAVALLRQQGIDAKLRIAGADDSLGKYQPVLEKLIDELNLRESVTLLGAVSEQVVLDGLESSHVFALGSLHEPLGVAIMEAMAMQMPVVVTRAGGVPELVDDGIDGILVDAESAPALAEGLTRIARDPELATRLAIAGRQKVEKSFQSDQSAKVLAKHLGVSITE
jgi:glycosyltransferase involved in cell wall biosynthesis